MYIYIYIYICRTLEIRSGPLIWEGSTAIGVGAAMTISAAKRAIRLPVASSVHGHSGSAPGADSNSAL